MIGEGCAVLDYRLVAGQTGSRQVLAGRCLKCVITFVLRDRFRCTTRPPPPL